MRSIRTVDAKERLPQELEDRLDHIANLELPRPVRNGSLQSRHQLAADMERISHIYPQGGRWPVLCKLDEEFTDTLTRTKTPD